MTQVVRTTQDLITSSLYLLGELAVNETPDAFMLATGLEIINEIIDGFSVSDIYIPYLEDISFNFVPGQDQYTISNVAGQNPDVTNNRIVDLVFANYTVDTLVYPLQIIQEVQYRNVTRDNDVLTRPGMIYLEKKARESLITIYPKPDQPYACLLRCKVMLDQITEHQELTGLPPYFYGFLKYALAREFLSYYPSGNWPETAEKKYQDVFRRLKDGNFKDLTIIPSEILNSPQPFFWQNILVY